MEIGQLLFGLGEPARRLIARIVARKLVSRNEPHFNGHFPGHPVMPGVLILEALAQTGALLAATTPGIAACPLTQPRETADSWLVRDPRSGNDIPQMILRLGYGLPVPGTPRRPVAEILNEPRLPPG